MSLLSWSWSDQVAHVGRGHSRTAFLGQPCEIVNPEFLKGAVISVGSEAAIKSEDMVTLLLASWYLRAGPLDKGKRN
jgi:hypothetical protein